MWLWRTNNCPCQKGTTFSKTRVCTYTHLHTHICGWRGKKKKYIYIYFYIIIYVYIYMYTELISKRVPTPCFEYTVAQLISKRGPRWRSSFLRGSGPSWDTGLAREFGAGCVVYIYIYTYIYIFTSFSCVPQWQKSHPVASTDAAQGQAPFWDASWLHYAH